LATTDTMLAPPLDIAVRIYLGGAIDNFALDGRR